jgi:hypothetical protein
LVTTVQPVSSYHNSTVSGKGPQRGPQDQEVLLVVVEQEWLSQISTLTGITDFVLGRGHPTWKIKVHEKVR